MVDRAQGRKKSDFVAKTTVDAGAFMDYFVNGTNYKISYANFVGGLGVTGSIEQDGAPTGVAILDIDGTVNKIRNIESGAGILASVSAQNGVEIKHNFTADSTGTPLLLNTTDATPDIASLVAGNRISLTASGNHVTVAVVEQPRYGTVHMQGNSTATVISGTSTPTKVLGTFTTDIVSQFTGDATGKLTYTGGSTAVLTVKATVTFTSATAPNQDVGIYIAKNGTAIAGTKIVRQVDASGGANASTFFNVSLATNDYIELFVSNDTSTDNIIVSDTILGVI